MIVPFFGEDIDLINAVFVSSKGDVVASFSSIFIVSSIRKI